MKKQHKGAATLRRIVAKAKSLKKSHPGKKWTSYIKEAAKKV